METVEVHSKDFLIRWVQSEPGSYVSWKVQPLKRSINFCVFQRKGGSNGNHDIETFASTQGSLSERLAAAGFEPLGSNGFVRVENRDGFSGAAVAGSGHLLAFVFDNRFSISQSKHVQFSFNVEPPEKLSSQVPGQTQLGASDAAAAASAALYNPRLQARSGSSSSVAPPSQQQHHLPIAAAAAAPGMSLPHRASTDVSTSSVETAHPKQRRQTFSSETDGNRTGRQRQNTFSNHNASSDDELMRSLDGRYVKGFLQKKRRKQFQGFARRYFSLDKKTGLLNYYLNSKSSSLRGVMPVKIASIKTDQKTLQMDLNSGMEKWSLKVPDLNSFNAWQAEIREVRQSNAAEGESGSEPEIESEEELQQQEAAAADLPRSASNQPLPGASSFVETWGLDGTENVNDFTFKPDYSGTHTPKPSKLDKLKDLIQTLPEGPHRDRLNAAARELENDADHKERPAAKTLPSSATITTKNTSARRDSHSRPSESVVERWVSSLRDDPRLVPTIFSMMLGSLISPIQGIIVLAVVGLLSLVGFYVAKVKRHQGGKGAYGHDDQRSEISLKSDGTRGTLDTTASDDEEDDLSDQSDVEESGNKVSYVPQKPKYTPETEASAKKRIQGERDRLQNLATEDPEVAEAFRSHQEVEGVSKEQRKGGTSDQQDVSTTDEEPASAETSLYPLPLADVQRRKTIIGPKEAPPSLMTIIKKSRDPSTMTAPVTSNEPLSGVQYVAEIFENADLLDAASQAAPNSQLRVMLVAVFAVARASNNRCKERALRKPFTPLLGETFELVREDLGLRFISEKVMHKPEVVATQTESPHWTVHFTSRPHTKIWAKSVQLTDVGHVNVTFPDGESISFINSELFIRNVLAGERYVEPSGSMSVDSSSGLSATIEFKSGGMFSGRSEEVKITGGKTVFEGKWTEGIYHGKKVVWSPKDLVENPTKHYGWTVFASQLNEITSIEKGELPPNDSRLRPDLRLYEKQVIGKAEDTKLKLEQHQRERRKVLETQQKQHEPFFFVKTGDSQGHYVLKRGKENYWVRRQAKDWQSIPNYFE